MNTAQPCRVPHDMNATRLIRVIILLMTGCVQAAPLPREDSLRQAIEHLAITRPAQFPRAAEFLGRLAAATNDAAFAELQREALLAHPLLTAQPILFVVRHQYRPDHHNTETMFQTGEINTKSYQGGGALKIIVFAKGGEVRTLVDPGPEGVARDPDVSFDGKRVLFSMRRNMADDYHLYEVNVDGSGLRQLTSAPGVFDIDPIYLPDDRIVFSSSREPKYCMCNRHIMGNLHRMEADGANITQIGKSTLFEGHPTLLPDGRVLYDRWEYVDRNFGSAQGLWTCNPDGTSHAIYWGNNTASPGAVLEGRILPGTDHLLCTFSSCHDRPWGALAILDRRLGVDGRAPVLRTWPADAINLVNERGDFDAYRRVNPKYEDPYPLDDSTFLCARMTGKGEQMGMYLVDVFGNEVLLHVEDPGCFDPMPLAARPRPPVIPDRIDLARKDGTFYVQNVYEGTHMAGVKPGSIKSLRVIESPEKQTWTHTAWAGQGTIAPAMNWHDFNNKRILGTVPVEEDGSAYFSVPADTFVYFQLLDERGMMVQSMRSGTIVRPGERQSCVGCHENRLDVPPAAATATLALRRAPSAMEGWHGPARLFSYRDEVQPVFDKHCVRCHDYEHAAKAKVILAGDRGMAFNASYADLWTKGAIKVVGAGPSEIQPAYSWGSHASKLAKVLVDGHEDVKLNGGEFDRIVTWLDLNAPYYSSYASANPANLYGRAPLTGEQMKRLAELGVDLKPQGAVASVSFDRPEQSPCLKKFPGPADPAYQEALSILRAGQQALAANPEPDASGFKPCPVDQAREDKYAARRQIEERNRVAALKGERVYDR